MNYFKIITLLLVVFIHTGCTQQTGSKEKDYAALVNPFIGTIGGGNTFTGPVLPYGMIQPGPYMEYEDDKNSGVVYGFSHTHLSGMAGGGVLAPGDILVMPVDKPDSYISEVQSAFFHSNETAAPGYYKVVLNDPEIMVELTASARVAFHKYTFPQNISRGVYLKLENGFVTVNGNEISGCNNNKIYFVARFSEPFENYEIAVNNTPVTESDTVKANEIKSIFKFKQQNEEPILLKVAISTVSIEGARKNLESEMSGWDFEQAKKEARQTWNKELNKIQVEGGAETEQIIFYTSLYHSMIHPNVYMDVDGTYRSTNGKVYTANDFVNYTNFSLWDTFRALHPLFTIINQELTVDFIRTFLERYDHNGRMLIMEFNNEEGEVPPMIGYHSLSVVADAYEKGIRAFDVQKALQAMVKLANDSIRPEKELYLQYGFIPADFKGQSVSKTLEYCYDDWCVTRLAKDLDNDIEKSFSQRGNFYKNVFSPEVNFMRGRKSNFRFVDNFDPKETINHYTEANAYQYSTFVPHDINGLIELMGGDNVFEAWLDSCFSIEPDFSKINLRDVTGLIGQYAHGNEPSHHIAYLYNYVGLPWKTQEMVRRILTEMYTNQQDGLEGNEDCGQMSAWYVMSAMGFYSVTPGLDYYAIGSPVFDKITINLENGKKFEIIAKNNGQRNIYIQSAIFNENPYSKSYLKHADIIKGGTLVFEMGDSPNKSWGANVDDRPVASNNKFKFAASPDIEFSDVLFLNSREIKMSITEPNSKIYYTLDGTEPTRHSNTYKDPIVVSKPTVLKTISFADDKNSGYPVTVHFKQIAMLDAVNVDGLKPGIKFLYREGPQIKNAKEQSLAPILDTGVLKTFNVDAIKDGRAFGYNLSGYLKVPETGVYRFWLEANDGAVLYINDKLIIDNDGGHRAQVLDSKIGLKKGWHPIKVDYFQQGLAKSLQLKWSGPGTAEQEVSSEVLFH